MPRVAPNIQKRGQTVDSGLVRKSRNIAAAFAKVLNDAGWNPADGVAETPEALAELPTVAGTLETDYNPLTDKGQKSPDAIAARVVGRLSSEFQKMYGFTLTLWATEQTGERRGAHEKYRYFVVPSPLVETLTELYGDEIAADERLEQDFTVREDPEIVSLMGSLAPPKEAEGEATETPEETPEAEGEAEAA